MRNNRVQEGMILKQLCTVQENMVEKQLGARRIDGGRVVCKNVWWGGSKYLIEK